jgi:octaprenyl-diphosphate synthase
LGKAAGVDLLEGKLTLPLIYLLERDSSLRAAIQTVMRAGNYEQVERRMLLEAVESSGALERARRRASEYAEAARRSLENLPESPYCDALLSIPTYIIERDR